MVDLTEKDKELKKKFVEKSNFKKSGSKQLHLVLNGEINNILLKLSKERRVTKSHIVIEALCDYFEKRGL